MEESFACPECGTTVDVHGLAPGRKVVCGFCRQVVEIPYLRRVRDPLWRRPRFRRPYWWGVAWAGLGVAAAGMVVISLVRHWESRSRAAHARSIQALVEASTEHQRGGRFDRAVLELDTAIALCAGGTDADQATLRELQNRRGPLARRDAEACMKRLEEFRSGPFPLGDWLNLIARTETDGDLEPIRPAVRGTFQKLGSQAAEQALAAALAALSEGAPARALGHCEWIAGLLRHLDEPNRRRIRDLADDVIGRLVEGHGVLVEPIGGEWLSLGSSFNATTLLPKLHAALEAKGYLPPPEASGWRERWQTAPYRLSLQLQEHQEGHYLSTENRLTRVEALLSFAFRGNLLWSSTPTARTRVPLPHLPAYLASRVALSTARLEELERLLRDDAREQITEKLEFALQQLPPCVPRVPGRGA